MSAREQDELQGASLGDLLLDALRRAGEAEDANVRPVTPQRLATTGEHQPQAVSVQRTIASAPSPELVAQVADLCESSWAAEVRAGDPRFGLRSVPTGKTLAAHAKDLLRSDTSSWQLREVLDLADASRPIHQAIAAQSLEAQIVGLVSAASDQDGERLQALIDRLGWLHSDQLTLAVAGARIGVTRERMRQIQKNTLRRIPNQVWLSKLDEALLLLEQAAPVTFDEASALLVNAGVTKRAMSPRAVDRVAHALWHRSPLDGDSLARGFVSCDALSVSPERISSLASRRARASGVATVTALCAELVADGVGISVPSLRVVLRSADRVEFLDDSSFWDPNAPPHRDRLRNTVVSMLAVARQLTVDSLLDGLDRSYRFRNASRSRFDQLRVPSRDAFIAYLRVHPEFDIVGSHVVLNVPYEMHDILGGEELTLVDILRSAPSGVLSLRDAAEACIARGMNKTTTYLYLRGLSTVEEVSDGHFALRGTVEAGSYDGDGQRDLRGEV